MREDGVGDRVDVYHASRGVSRRIAKVRIGKTEPPRSRGGFFVDGDGAGLHADVADAGVGCGVVVVGVCCGGSPAEPDL